MMHSNAPLIYDPPSIGVRRVEGMAILRCDGDWHDMMLWHMGKAGLLDRHKAWRRVIDADRHEHKPAARLGLVNLDPGLVQPHWGPHITVCRRERHGRWGWSRGDRFRFSMDWERVALAPNQSHWYIPVHSDDLREYRATCGLSADPRVPLHLTFAVVPGKGV